MGNIAKAISVVYWLVKNWTTIWNLVQEVRQLLTDAPGDTKALEQEAKKVAKNPKKGKFDLFDYLRSKF